MEDQVPFKVFTHWEDGAKPEVRRFGVDKNFVTNFNYLQTKIVDIFPNLKEKKQFNITWKDEDGDHIKISSNEEVLTMLASVSGGVVKLFVHILISDKTDAARPVKVTVSEYKDATISPESEFHIGVCCDGCNRRVIGFRYKCVTCEDFDLCSQCEAQRLHPQHCVVRIPTPNMSLIVIKESIKKSRQFLKSVASNLYEAKKQKHVEKKASASCSANPGPSPAPIVLTPDIVLKNIVSKDRRADRREERQEKRQERQERREEERRERRENSHEPRSGWIDVFSKYVDQFANLAADHIRVAGATAGEPNSSNVTSSEGPVRRPSPLLEEMLRCPPRQEPAIKPLSMCKSFEEQRAVLHQMLNELNAELLPTAGMAARAWTSESVAANTSTAAAVPADATAPAASTATASVDSTTAYTAAVTAAATTPVATTAPAATVAPVATTTPAATKAPAPFVIQVQPPLAPPYPCPVMTQEDKVDAKSDASSTSSVGSVSRGSSPDKGAEEWTMINQDKEFEVDGASHVPIENLPAEFQPRSGLSYGQLYPPLNEATAVHDPNVAGAAFNAGPSTAPQPTAPGAPTESTAHPWTPLTPQGQASAPAAAKPPAADERHRVPHIDAAIRQMISMGFTNEGGWLTQLLESKDGNIAAVLDLLTPVNPHKK